MKTYLKRAQENPSTSIFYASGDIPGQSLSRDHLRHRIVQPSTKEQQRLLWSTSSARLQHVHWGKYGIKPLWPSEKSSCEQWQEEQKTNEYPWSSFFSSRTPRNERNRCFNLKSDSQKRPLLSSTSAIPWLTDQHESILIVASISLLLLLLVYFVYRRQRTQNDQSKPNDQQRRRSVEDNLRHHHAFEDRLSAVRSLPTIVEENPTAPPSPSNSPNQISPSSAAAVSDDSDKASVALTALNQRQPVLKPTSDTSPEEPASLRRRRSRFDQDSNKPVEDPPCPPVIIRKFSTTHQHAITDDYKSLEEINAAVKKVGLVHSQLIFGIDYTISNLETGKHSFKGLSLHHIQAGLLNPYQSVITIVGRTLEKYDSDTLIPAFGFGDRSTLDRKIFPLRPDGSYCKGFQGVLDAYNEITPKVRMSGPTNFAPLIREAVRIVKKTRQYHILVIVADGQVTNEQQTKDAIVEASNYPLSIVMIGVGDGPWEMMNEFDDSLPTRQFDNFQFVNFNSVLQASKDTESDFALHALMEIPSQYAAIKELGLLQMN